MTPSRGRTRDAVPTGLSTFSRTYMAISSTVMDLCRIMSSRKPSAPWNHASKAGLDA